MKSPPPRMIAPSDLSMVFIVLRFAAMPMPFCRPVPHVLLKRLAGRDRSRLRARQQTKTTLLPIKLSLMAFVRPLPNSRSVFLKDLRGGFEERVAGGPLVGTG